MAVDIFTIRDLILDAANLNATRIGTPSGITTKPAGGIRLTQNAGSQFDVNSTSSATSVPEGLIFNLVGGPVDFTDRLFMISIAHNATNRIQIPPLGTSGLLIRLYSGTGFSNYAEWHVGGNDTAVGSNPAHLNYIIDPASTPQRTVGTFDITDVRTYGVAQGRFNQAATGTPRIFFSRQADFGTAKGGSNMPRVFGASSAIRELHEAVAGTGYTTIYHNNTLQIGETYVLAMPFTIGKPGTATSFSDEGVTVISPASNDLADPRLHLTNNTMRIYLDLQDADTVALSGSYIWGTTAPFDFDSSVGASVNISGATFSGMGDFTVGDDISGAASFSLAAGSKVIINDANLDGSAIAGDATLSTVKKLSGISIGGQLEIQQAGDYSFSNVAFTSSGTQINVSATTGTVNISVSGGTVPTFTTAGATVNITQSADFTVTGLQANSEVRAYTGSGASAVEIGGIENSGTEFTFTHSAPGQQGFIVVASLNYVNIFLPVTYSAQNVSIPVQQVADRQYENP